MKIVMFGGRYWLVEYESMKYPSKGLPVYLASPIYQNKKGELEMRRAGLDWLFSEKCTDSNLSEKERQEVKNSIKDFLEDCQGIMKEQYKDSDVYKRLYPLIYNYGRSKTN